MLLVFLLFIRDDLKLNDADDGDGSPRILVSARLLLLFSSGRIDRTVFKILPPRSLLLFLLFCLLFLRAASPGASTSSSSAPSSKFVVVDEEGKVANCLRDLIKLMKKYNDDDCGRLAGEDDDDDADVDDESLRFAAASKSLSSLSLSFPP